MRCGESLCRVQRGDNDARNENAATRIDYPRLGGGSWPALAFAARKQVDRTKAPKRARDMRTSGKEPTRACVHCATSARHKQLVIL
jgi:hypothetical protein